MNQEEAKRLLQLTEGQQQLVDEFCDLFDRMTNAEIAICCDITSGDIAAFNLKHSNELRNDFYHDGDENCVSVPLTEFVIKPCKACEIEVVSLEDYVIDVKNK